MTIFPRGCHSPVCVSAAAISSSGYVLSITDFLGAASKIAQRDGRLVEMYVFAAVVYFLICLAASQAVKCLSTVYICAVLGTSSSHTMGPLQQTVSHRIVKHIFPAKGCK